MKNDLKNLFLFSDLDDETIDKIAKFSKIEKVSKNGILFYEGDKSSSLCILKKGIVKLYKSTSNAKEVVLKYFNDNELIAEVANFEEINYPATALAFTDIEVIKIDFSLLKEIILEKPELSYKIMTSLIKKIKNLENVISNQIVLDSNERVAKYIYEHSETFFSTKNIIIAEMLNISAETLSRILRVFKDENIIDTTNKTIDKNRLKAYFS